MNDIVYSFLLSILPIAELRGGLPYAILKADMDPLYAYALCVGANILVYPITILFLEFFHKHFMKWGFYAGIFDKMVVRTQKKTTELIERYGFWGLMIFVMIPLPVTGAYTGTFAAWLFGIKKRKAFLAVSLGVIISGIIVSTVVLTGSEALNFLIKNV